MKPKINQLINKSVIQLKRGSPTILKEHGGQSYYDDPKGKYTDPVTGKKQSLSLINKRAEEGDWGEWSKTLPSQFLSKQSLSLIKKQLGLATADKQSEFDEICSLTNPTVKKTLLKSFADDCDSAAVHLQAAALPRQKYQVILPLTTIKDNEVYAPNYKDGETVALIRYPHGGTFEIPILKVNNKLAEGKSVLGNTPADAIGINKKNADRLSGADFDGDTVMVIPCNSSKSKVKITSTHSLKGLEDFDTNMTVLKPSSMRSLLGGVDGSILDVYGGEYEFDKFNVKLWNKRGADRGVSIRYGKNLTDLKQEENCSSVYTGVYPFWYSEQEGLVQLNEKIVKASGTYNFTRIYPLDLSQEWQEKPNQEQLRTRANSYMKANNIGVPAVSLTVSFVQLSQSSEYAKYALLEDVHLCDTVGVEFPELNVNATAKCIKTIYDAISNKYVSIELGESRTNLASTISDQKQAISDTITKTFMQQAIENATQLISGGLGGYVIMHSSTGGKYPDEILIMDTDDIATAKKVWRWNKGGLGYSSTGYNGPFALAMTQDGQIVADFVKTGTMSANRINGGTLILGGKNNSNGTALIKDTDGNVLIRLDRNGITLSEDVQISYENISDTPSIPTKVSELTNDSKYTTMSAVEDKGYQTKANVTKITKDTVTTTYVNALNITAKQVNCKSGSKEANINAGASHYKYADKYIGEIGTNSWTGNDNRRGLVFDLDEDGDYMTWAAQPKSGQSYLVKLLYERNGYNSNDTTYDADTINLGCNVDMHYYKLKNVSWENGGGITGTMNFVQIDSMNDNGTAARWRSGHAYLKFERGVLIGAGWNDY